MEGYYASTRPDSFLIRKAVVPGPGHSGWPMAPENEGINVAIPTGVQAIPLEDPHWNQNGEENGWR
jgi:hypothetical protein